MIQLTELDNPIPRPLPIEQIECDQSKPYHGEDSCFPLHKASEPAWSISEVFGRPIQGSCTLTDNEETAPGSVCVNVPAERTVEIKSEVQVISTGSEDGNTRCYKLPSNGTNFDLIFPEQALSSSTPLKQPRFHTARSITGYGQERGGVQAVISNPSPTESIDLVYLESLPWYMKPYLHTLRASLSTNNAPTTIDPIKETYYRPALDRHRGTHLELLLTVPPSSTLTITYDFEKAILRYTEYPPDANRGFDVAPAVIRLLPSSRPLKGPKQNIYLRTTSLLLPLPTPDFSMPYNVIILTSTVMALGFGSIFNLLVRRLVAADEVGPVPIAIILLQLRGRLRHLIWAAWGKLRRKGEKAE
jgi:phosphatidylinositol glycan class T